MTGAGDSARRFSNRVADYVRYRPGYPDALFDWLHREQGVPPAALVADIGAGTGIATRAWLRRGHPVIAVEPNAAMREALVAGLAGEPGLRVADGNAEATGLEPASVDLVASAQAFHWFEPDATRREWARILRPGGLACVFWNSRLPDASPFLRDYEALLHAHGEDYARVAERHPDDAAMRAWFGPVSARWRGLRMPSHWISTPCTAACAPPRPRPRPGIPGTSRCGRNCAGYSIRTPNRA